MMSDDRKIEKDFKKWCKRNIEKIGIKKLEWWG